MFPGRAVAASGWPGGVQNDGMKRVGKWLALGLLIASLLLGAGLLALHRWIGTDDFRSRVEAQARIALGKEVVIGALVVDIWPVPAVALNAVQIKTSPAILVARVEVRPVLASLLAARLELATLLVRHADVSQAAVDELLLSLPQRKPAPGGSGGGGTGSADDPALVPRRVVLDTVTWRSASGVATTVNADAHLDALGLPDRLVVTVLAGRFQGAGAKLLRKAQIWDVDIDLAGGTVKGAVERLVDPGAAKLALKGQFETRNVELGVLLRKPSSGGANKAGSGDSPMRGKLVASTRFTAQAQDLEGLLAGLQSESRFTVQDAVVHGVDLARAVRTVGLNRGGETRLDTLTGQLDTRGRAIHLRNLAASSGALSASGNVAVAPNRALSGRVNVNLAAKVVGSAVGVPLVVGGTVDAPEVTLTRSAMIGAAIGTLVMPGVGTGAGASLGDKLGDKLKGLFGR